MEGRERKPALWVWGWARVQEGTDQSGARLSPSTHKIPISMSGTTTALSGPCPVVLPTYSSYHLRSDLSVSTSILSQRRLLQPLFPRMTPDTALRTAGTRRGQRTELGPPLIMG